MGESEGLKDGNGVVGAGVGSGVGSGVGLGLGLNVGILGGG